VFNFRTFILIIALAIFHPNTGWAKNHVDAIEIIKHKRELKLITNDRVVKVYHISLGNKSKGRKLEDNDGRTPEGSYVISRKITDDPHHRRLQISFPNPEDRAQAKLQGKSLECAISIHGLPSYCYYVPQMVAQYQRWYDWTNGNIAVTDLEIDEIFDLVDIGTPVIIFA
jgi:murein L,D-transpeptidase YafK